MGIMAHLDNAVLDEAWVLYKASGYLEHRNRLVLHYSSLVRYVAVKVGASLPPMVDRDDLVSYGMFGLMDAIEKFDLDKGVKFETYAMARIRGAIYDEIRNLDWVPRSVRSKGRDLERARVEVEAALGRPASDEELAQNLGLSMEDYWAFSSQASVTVLTALTDGAGGVSDSDFETSWGTVKVDPNSDPSQLFESEEVADLVGAAISNMDERSKTILALYYLQEMTLSEIGKIMGVTESRVCQLQSKALAQLGESLGQGGLVAA